MIAVTIIQHWDKTHYLANKATFPIKRTTSSVLMRSIIPLSKLCLTAQDDSCCYKTSLFAVKTSSN